jgi:hypothetical protein
MSRTRLSHNDGPGEVYQKNGDPPTGLLQGTGGDQRSLRRGPLLIGKIQEERKTNNFFSFCIFVCFIFHGKLTSCLKIIKTKKIK